MMLRLMLTDSLWSKISVLLPPDTGRRGRPSPKTRMIVEGILWRHRTGSPWRDVPDAFGPWPTVFSRFNRWSKVGVWQTLFSTVNKEADREWHFVDSTSIRAHQHGSGARKGIERAIGSSRGGPTTKIHTLADGLGNPVRFILTGGQVHDSQPFAALVAGTSADYVIADKGYDAGWIRSVVLENQGCPVIPQRRGSAQPNPHYDKAIYKSRHVIENLFAKMKQWRAVATRYEKNPANFMAVLHIVSAIIWLT
jgi:transposase